MSIFEWFLVIAILFLAYIVFLNFGPLLHKIFGKSGLQKGNSVPNIESSPLGENYENFESGENGTVLGAHLKRAVKCRDFKLYIAIFIVISIVMLVPALKAGVVMNYCKLLVPTALVSIVLAFYACSQRANPYCVYGLLIVNVCAALSRAAFGNEANVGTNIYIYMLVGLIVTFVLAWVHRFFSKTSHWQWILAGFATIAVILLCLFVKEENGARNWWKIGGLSIQLTEVAKFFYVFFVGILYFSNVNVKSKFVTGFLVTILCCGLLFGICNELGTALVIFLSYLFTTLFGLKDLSIKDKKNKSALKAKYFLVAFAFVGVFAAFGLYNTIASNVGVWDCPKEDCNVVNSFDLETCSKCKTEKSALGAAFNCPFCDYVTWDEIELVKDEAGIVNRRASCPHCNNIFLLKGKVGDICKKLYDRFSITYDFERIKGTDIVYQTEQCHSAMKVGGLFGDMDTIVNVPIYTVDTDSVVATLTNRLGLVFVLVVLLGFALIFISVWEAYSPLRIMAICALVFQTVITYLGTINFIPATGIGVPLISRGGSNLVICYMLIYLILSSVKFAKGGNKNEQE